MGRACLLTAISEIGHANTNTHNMNKNLSKRTVCNKEWKTTTIN